MNERETTLFFIEQSTKEINPYFSKAGSSPGPNKQLGEGGGRTAMDREELYPDVDSTGRAIFVQHFKLDQARDTALASPADVSSSRDASPQLWKTEFSFYPIRYFPCRFIQSTELL